CEPAEPLLCYQCSDTARFPLLAARFTRDPSVKVTNVDYSEAPTEPVQYLSLVFKMTGPTHITRTIINRDGTVTVGPTIEVPVSGIGLARSLSAADLAEIARADLAVAIKRLIKMTRVCDPATRQ